MSTTLLETLQTKIAVREPKEVKIKPPNYLNKVKPASEEEKLLTALNYKMRHMATRTGCFKRLKSKGLVLDRDVTQFNWDRLHSAKVGLISGLSLFTALKFGSQVKPIHYTMIIPVSYIAYKKTLSDYTAILDKKYSPLDL